MTQHSTEKPPTSEADRSPTVFLTLEMIEQLQFSGDLPPITEGVTSYIPKHDSHKVEILIWAGIPIPPEWYRPGDSQEPVELGILPQPEYYAHIVTAAIIYQRMRDIAALIGTGITGEGLETEIEYHSRQILVQRLDTEDHRHPDVTEQFAARQDRLQSQGISCNPTGRLSMDELISVRDRVLAGFRKSQ